MRGRRCLSRLRRDADADADADGLGRDDCYQTRTHVEIRMYCRCSFTTVVTAYDNPILPRH